MFQQLVDHYAKDVSETLEVMHALRQINEQGSILRNQFSFREDPIAAAPSSIHTIRALDRLLDRINFPR